MKKRMPTIQATLLLIILFLAGCSNHNNQTGTTSATSATASTSTTSAVQNMTTPTTSSALAPAPNATAIPTLIPTLDLTGCSNFEYQYVFSPGAPKSSWLPPGVHGEYITNNAVGSSGSLQLYTCKTIVIDNLTVIKDASVFTNYIPVTLDDSVPQRLPSALGNRFMLEAFSDNATLAAHLAKRGYFAGQATFTVDNTAATMSVSVDGAKCYDVQRAPDPNPAPENLTTEPIRVHGWNMTGSPVWADLISTTHLKEASGQPASLVVSGCRLLEELGSPYTVPGLGWTGEDATETYTFQQPPG